MITARKKKEVISLRKQGKQVKAISMFTEVSRDDIKRILKEANMQ